ncbi:MAG: hypothetical protein J2P36_25935, partial [Ktedonobacteraceae bacterium]|nr:hypothetical protein [Ktedonobacteraceae bacterium]
QGERDPVASRICPSSRALRSAESRLLMEDGHQKQDAYVERILTVPLSRDQCLFRARVDGELFWYYTSPRETNYLDRGLNAARREQEKRIIHQNTIIAHHRLICGIRTQFQLFSLCQSIRLLLVTQAYTRHTDETTKREGKMPLLSR